MKKYHVTYRQEFWTVVEAESKEDAIKKAEKSAHWALLSEGHQEFYEVEKTDV